jgi:hypothetical protein
MTTLSRIRLVLFFLVAFSAASAASSWAQVQAEVGVDFGYTESKGVNASQPHIVAGQTYNSLDITRGPAFGFEVGVYVTENYEVEFLWHRQFSSLEISTPAPTLKVANQNVDNYHGNLVYNFGEHDAKTRPFIFGGLGATHYTPGDYDPAFPGSAAQAKIGGLAKFSTTWGGGVKYYPNPKIGVRGTVRWTPTYIKSTAGGVWCDFYGCWTIANAEYSQQLEFTGGVTFRFGGS